MNRPHAPKISQSVRRAALIVATLTSFLGPFMASSVNVALPSIGREFSLSTTSLGWVNMAFLLVAAAFSIPFGRLGDISGRKRIYMLGVAVFTIGSVLIALATSGPAAILFRAIQGLGASMIFATGMAILVSVFPPKERGKVLGINVAAVYLGLSLGPFIGGIVTQYLGWRFIFWLNLPIGIVLLSVIFTMLKGEWAEAAGARFDLIGSLILVSSLSLTMYAFSELPWRMAIVLLVVGVVGIALFTFFERRQEHPLIDVELFRTNRVFAFSSLAALINYAATFGVTFLLSIYLQKVREYSPQEAGLVLVSQPAVQALFSPFAGRLSDRIEPRTVASLGMAISCVGIVMLNFVAVASPISYVIGCLVVLGLGFAFFSSPNTKAIMSSVERKTFGVASAVVGTMRQVGMSFSMGIVMMILAMVIGQVQIDESNAGEFVDSMRISFTVFAVMCFGGVFASLARGVITSPPQNSDEKTSRNE